MKSLLRVVAVSLLLSTLMSFCAFAEEDADLDTVEYTDIFYAYPYYLLQNTSTADIQMLELANNTLSKASNGSLSASSYETFLEKMASPTAIAEAILQCMTGVDFDTRDAADAAAIAILNEYYSNDEYCSTVSADVLNYIKPIKDAVSTAVDAAKIITIVREEGMTDMEYFLECYDAYVEGLNYSFSTHTYSEIPKLAKGDVESVYKGLGSPIIDIAKYAFDLANATANWWMIKNIQVELVDYIIENSYADGELLKAFKRIRSDINSNGFNYIIKHFAADAAYDALISKALSLSTAGAYAILGTACTAIQWFFFDVLNDTPNYHDWMTFSYIAHFYCALSEDLTAKTNSILTKPMNSKVIDDFEYFHKLYAAAASTMLAHANKIDGSTLSENYGYILDYNALAQKCIGDIAVIPFENRVMKTKSEDSHSIKDRAIVYISETEPEAEHDYWIKPFRGEVIDSVSVTDYGHLYITCNTTVPGLSIFSSNSSELPCATISSCVVTVLNNCSLSDKSTLTLTNKSTFNIQKQLLLGRSIGTPATKVYLNDGTMNVYGDIDNYSFWFSSYTSKIYCDTGNLYIGGNFISSGPLAGKAGITEIFVESGTLIVDGEARNFYLNMQDEDGYALFNNNCTCYFTRLTAGVLDLKGTSTLCYRDRTTAYRSYSGFSAGGTHRTILSGESEQRLVCGRFNIIEKRNPLARVDGEVEGYVIDYTKLNTAYVNNNGLFATDIGNGVEGVELNRITEGALFDSINARMGESPFTLGSVTNNNSTEVEMQIASPDESKSTTYLYRINGSFITPLEVKTTHGNVVFNSDESGTYLVTRVPALLYGDTTADGEINLLDSLRAAKKLVGDEVSLDEAAMDVNHNERFDVGDLLLIIKATLN